jgi:aryl-alcohol dehydrogenase (NADP+)
MQHTRLGRTGLKVSRLCLGTMTFGLQCDEATSSAILDTAAEAGITFLDTADVYPLGGTLETNGRTEEILGKWLTGRRHDFVLATKCFGTMSARPWDRGSSRSGSKRWAYRTLSRANLGRPFREDDRNDR